jgi:hypothetical protein
MNIKKYYATAFMKLIVFLMLSHSTTLVQGQTIIDLRSHDVKWEYNDAQDKKNNESMTISGYFVTHGDQQVEWFQNGTDTSYSFTIISTSGTWADINEDGELLFNAVCNDLHGTIRIYRSSENLYLHLDFTESNALSPNFLLSINSYSKL